MSFPYIESINDVLPSINDRPEFTVSSSKNGYDIIAYNVSLYDSFDDPIRRECRGITFDSSTGEIIRRPFHKFFNLNEKEETQAHKIDFIDSPHRIYKKLDGSMISPMLVNGIIHWGTKRGQSDIAIAADHFIHEVFDSSFRVNFIDWNLTMLESGFTPIYEYLSIDPRYRVIIEHEHEDLILLAVRNMKTGEYINDIDELAYPGKTVESIDQSLFSSINDLAGYTRPLIGEEGFVVAFDDTGERIKIKADHYCHLHKMKELVSQERHIVKAELKGNLDDVIGLLPKTERQRVLDVIHDFWKTIHFKAHDLEQDREYILRVYGKDDLKKISLEFMAKKANDKLTESMLFRLIKNPQLTAFDVMLEHAKKTLDRSETRFQEFKRWCLLHHHQK